MKTSKEMQLKIIDKMRENVENDLALMNSIQYRNRVNSLWDDRIHDVGASQFERLEMRVKPQTITINGVEIPKPLSRDDIKYGIIYYYVNNNKSLYEQRYGEFIHAHGIRFVYSTEAEAIEASKLLFGIED